MDLAFLADFCYNFVRVIASEAILTNCLRSGLLRFSQ